MKHILFVDDDPTVLRGLQRMLEPLRDEWKMAFAHGGEAGKKALVNTELDVVITELAMPGVDGAQVLAAAREFSPRTIRLVLTGQAGQPLVMECVGLAHQCLAKPYDLEALRKIITRVTGTGFAVRNERLMTLVAKLKHLPSLPSIYLQLVRLMNDPDASMDQVGNLIGSDMAMTAKVLQLVNSSFFGLARNISKPAEAAAYLGLETLKALVLAAGVFAQYEKRTSRDFSANLAARHSQQVGVASQAIARFEQSPSALVDQALVAGLLHDIGKMMLASNLPDEYQRALKNEHVTPLEAEKAIFGANHAEIGAYLLGLWGLPAAVVDAIGFHHAPLEADETKFSALTAVHAANFIIAEQTVPAAQRSPLDLDYLHSLGLGERMPAWRQAVQQFMAPR